MDTVGITIDGKKLEVEAGAGILEVAKREGIYIPHLCYFEGLSVYGGCRLCVVEVEGLPYLPQACIAKVNDGMVIRTDTAAVREMQRGVMELILSDHPGRCLDCHRRKHCRLGDVCLRDNEVTERCITCAKNGSCELQDVAEFLDMQGWQRYYGETTHWYSNGEWQHRPIERTNPFIEREYDKCILCTRCVRVCEEIRGVSAIQLTNRGFQAEINSPFGLPLHETNCEFCGACVEVCPTAALMDRQSKWLGAPERVVETICPYCGVGCGIRLELSGDRILRSRPNPESPVNRGQLCVKGRYGLGFVHHPDRLSKPLIKRDGAFVEASWEEALDLIAHRLSEYKGDQFAAIASAKCTNEENYLIQKFARAVMGTNNVDHCARL